MKTIADWYKTDNYKDELTEAYKAIDNNFFVVPTSAEEEELTPYEQPYRLENWPFEDLVMYVGGIYAKQAYTGEDN